MLAHQAPPVHSPSVGEASWTEQTGREGLGTARPPDTRGVGQKATGPARRDRGGPPSACPPFRRQAPPSSTAPDWNTCEIKFAHPFTRAYDPEREPAGV